MPKLKKLSQKNELTASQKKAVRGGWIQFPDEGHCGAGCKSRCGTKSDSKGNQYEALW